MYELVCMYESHMMYESITSMLCTLVYNINI